jgi:hypothetical protein
MLREPYSGRNRLGLADPLDRLLEVAARSRLVTMGAQQEIDRVAFLVDGAVQIFPLASDLDAGFIHPPTLANWAFVFAKRLSKQGTSLITQRCTRSNGPLRPRAQLLCSRFSTLPTPAGNVVRGVFFVLAILFVTDVWRQFYLSVLTRHNHYYSAE